MKKRNVVRVSPLNDIDLELRDIDFLNEVDTEDLIGVGEQLLAEFLGLDEDEIEDAGFVLQVNNYGGIVIDVFMEKIKHQFMTPNDDGESFDKFFKCLRLGDKIIIKKKKW